jgi:hypothetical protein
MPRYAAKVDANQKEIVSIYRKAGATVQHLHAVGEGCPDLLVGYRGANYLVEVKDGAKVPSARKLTPDQVVWHRDWRGSVRVVKDTTEALAVIGLADTLAVVPITGTIS